MSKPFVFNDENVYNVYGFRVLTAGIDLSRFTNNPVMLDGHWASNENVIGKWDEVKANGAILSGLPIFDNEDDNAKSIAGKVDRGFIKSCSMGFTFNEADMQFEGNGKYVLVKCELLEVSIVAIPANANAVRLYSSETGELLKEDAVKLCLSGLQEKNFKHKNDTMKKVVLSAAALVALGLDKHNSTEGVDADLVEQGIKELQQKITSNQQKLTAAETALKALQDSATTAKKQAALKVVETAIAEGKIDATAKDEWVALAESNEALATTTLAALPAKKTLSTQVNNITVDTGEVKTMDDFEKLPLAAQLAFKKENPDAYKKIVG